MLGVIVYLLVLAVIKAVVIARGIPIFLDSPESFGFVVMVPLTTTGMARLLPIAVNVDPRMLIFQTLAAPLLSELMT